MKYLVIFASIIALVFWSVRLAFAEDQVTARKRADCVYSGGSWNGYSCQYPGTQGQNQIPATGRVVIYNYCRSDLILAVSVFEIRPEIGNGYGTYGLYRIEQKIFSPKPDNSLGALFKEGLTQRSVKGIILHQDDFPIRQSNDHYIYVYGYLTDGSRRWEGERQFSLENGQKFNFIEANVYTSPDGDAEIKFCPI